MALYLWPVIIPSGNSDPPLNIFPTLAVQVSASLLGFYLASVSIVLGQSYSNVSADVRELVLGNPQTKLHLGSVGMAIGAGLTLVLLQSVEVSYGYVTVAGYVTLVAFSGWAFIRLAFGAFNLFDPVVLAQQPLLELYRTINRLGSGGLSNKEAVLGVASHEANRALRILAELIELTSYRVSFDRGRLAGVIETLLILVQIYTRQKHVLTPNSQWFIREPVYPKWIEATESETSVALKSSTPLQPRLQPSSYWLERRSAELASSALASCVAANDRDSALRITNQVAETARVLARSYRINEAIEFSAVVRDRCWSIGAKNLAADAVAMTPPLFLANLILGWREAIMEWPEEIRTTVNETKWDRRSTRSVQIRGSDRVWNAAQQLLKEVKAEQEIQGHRTTPDWYLQLALADVCLLSLREFAKELPNHLETFLNPTPKDLSPEVEAMTGSQSLQALAKAQFVADTLPQAVENLEALRMGNNRQEAEEFDSLNDVIRKCRTEVLQGIAGALIQLQPKQTKSEPDLFGEAYFTLIHHIEEAVATGDVALVKEVFPKILYSSFVLQDYVLSTYQSPTYQVNSAIWDPAVDILELSGLALAYAALRGDQSDAPVRQAWIELISSYPHPDEVARMLLDGLEIGDGYTLGGISPRDIARTEWEMRLSKEVVKAGYGGPKIFHFTDETPEWNAPLIIKMMGVSDQMPTMFLKPRTIFAAEVIGPLSGETRDKLKSRQSLRHFYEQKDFHNVLEDSEDNSS